MGVGNLKIATKLYVLVGVFVVGFAAFGWLAYSTLQTVKVNGPHYQRIVQNKDLVADVLPPPEYILESYLVMHQLLAAEDKDAVAALVNRERALHTDFDTRHTYWATALPDDKLKQELVATSYEPAKRFYEQFESELIPAITAGDKVKARAVALGTMTQAYDEHRKAIDEVVTLANAQSERDEQTAAGVISDSTAHMVMFGGALTLCIVALGWFIARVISQPLRKAVAILGRVADGDFTVHLDANTTDEVGQMAGALNTAIASMGEALTRVRAVADTVAAASQQLSASAEEISGGAQVQAASLEETAASLEEIAATIKQNADNAHQANQLANSSRGVAEHGGDIVRSTVAAMAEISASSRRISDITSAIDEIAFQTNLLALNAAVEAARAGEQGRGFAVVASEVRNLAQRSASASKEIKGLIDDSSRKVEAGSEHVDQSGHSLDEIVTSVKRLTDIVGEIASASREQHAGIDLVNKAVSNLDHVTQQNAAQTEELSATAHGLSDQAAELQALVARFTLAGAPAAPRAPAPVVRRSAAPPAAPAPNAPRARRASLGGTGAAPSQTISF